MKKTGRSDYFPEETGYWSYFFIMFACTKLKCAIKRSTLDSKRFFFKSTLSIFQGLHFHQRNFLDLDYKRGITAISELRNVFFFLITRRN